MDGASRNDGFTTFFATLSFFGSCLTGDFVWMQTTQKSISKSFITVGFYGEWSLVSDECVCTGWSRFTVFKEGLDV